MTQVTAAPFTSSLAESLAPAVTERLIRYAKVDTQSQPGPRAQSPSTARQLDLSRLLLAELTEIGLLDAALDENGYVTATLPASPGAEEAPTIGLVSHVDVSPDAP